MRKRSYKPSAYVDEFSVQRAICINVDKYGVPGLVYWHVPNGGKRDAFEAKRFKDSGVKAGIPDLHFLYRRQLYMIEVKAEAGRLSAAQKEIIPRLLTAGAIVAVANTLPRALWYLTQWGLISGCPLPIDPPR